MSTKQMPLPELRTHLQDAALSNPMLEVEFPPLEDTLRSAEPAFDEAYGAQPAYADWSTASADYLAHSSAAPTFSDYLKEQLGQLPGLEATVSARCAYLIDCLDRRGYLDFPLATLAKEMGISLAQAEQYLYVVQMLEPAGVGARSLCECLMLQLAAGRDFTAANLRLIQYGLPLLAKKDYAGLEKLLGLKRAAVLAACQTVQALNPVPSSGFDTGESGGGYLFPEAEIFFDGDLLRVEMTDRHFYSIRIHTDYTQASPAQYTPQDQQYIHRQMAEADQLLENLHRRRNTLYRLIFVVAQVQRDFLLYRQPLRPLTMQQAADRLALHVSTVSRACRNKYISYNGRIFPLRELFCAACPSDTEASFSISAIRCALQAAVRAEDSANPLSDEALSAMLAKLGMSVPRRTVAKYRAELGIPNRFARQKGSRTK